MRKIILMTILILGCGMASAQSLMDLFKAVVESSTTTVAKSVESPLPLDKESVVGDWKFGKFSAGIEEGSSMSGFAGGFAISQLEGMMNSYATSIGVTPGFFCVEVAKRKMKLKYKERDHTCRYSLNEDDSTVMIMVGEIDNIEVGSVEGKVTRYDDRVVLLFNARKLIAIAEKSPSVAQSSQFQTIKRVVYGVDGLLLGVTMQRVQ